MCLTSLEGPSSIRPGKGLFEIMMSCANAIEADQLADLSDNVARSLREFIQALLECAGPRIESVILFGSAAEGRLRPTSDINLLVISRQLDLPALDAIRTQLRSGHAAVGLKVMFLDSSEVAHALESFAVKFSDIKARHRILYGAPSLDAVKISREATLRRLRQVLLNLTLRLRERYASEGDHEEALGRVLADLTGPLRAGAATLLSLRDG